MNTYEQEQAFTDKYGDTIMKQIAGSFYSDFDIIRVTDRDTQISGVDYKITNKAARSPYILIDLKMDYYDNQNFVFETTQQYTGIGEKSWIEHDPKIWIAYFKIAARKCFIYKLGDLQDFRNTVTFQNRKEIETIRRVNGKAGTFKNFRLDELPVHHITEISLMWNPFEKDPLLQTKADKPGINLYEDVVQHVQTNRLTWGI